MAEKKDKLTLDALKPRDYEFDVETPDGDTVVFTFRAPSQSAFWDITADNPAPDQDTFVNRSMPFHKDAHGNPVPVLDKLEYQKALEAHFKVMMFRKILTSWVDADTLLKSKTEEERIVEMDGLAAWVINALWRISQLLMATRADAISARSFRRN